MNDEFVLRPIAYFHSPFDSKFGIPKQSGVVPQLAGTVVFEPAFRDVHALRGIEGFDYLWLVWKFSANPHDATHLLVRPPLLGGNEKVGVFASRSPFRPNPIGLSSVRLQRVEWESECGPVLHVLGGDLMDGTPIYDIKPYLPFTDSHADARSGFTDLSKLKHLDVRMPAKFSSAFTAEERQTLLATLALDPRPAYHAEDTKTYGMPFADKEVKFRVIGGKTVEVVSVER